MFCSSCAVGSSCASGYFGSFSSEVNGWPFQRKSALVALLGELIEIVRPLSLVVEPGEVFGRVGVVVLGALVGDLGLLQADDGAAKFELRMVFEVELAGRHVPGVDAADEFFSAP